MRATITAAIAMIAFGRFVLLSGRVFSGRRFAGSAVVCDVGRVILASVIVCGRTLVSISLDNGAEASFTVPASALTGQESLIKAVPSTRQNTSLSSFSTRPHWGHRFINVAQAVSLPLPATDAN